MIPLWIKHLFRLADEVPPQYDDCALGSKTRGLQNMKRLNEFVLGPDCKEAHLTELEIGAETISLNLKKGDTDRAKKKEGAV